MNGYVYVLTNSAFPHLVKIGRTVNSPHIRAEELSSTGVPSKFTVAYYQRFEDCVEAEKMLHNIFSEYRSNMRREFFDIDAKEAIDVIRELPGQIPDDGEIHEDEDIEDYSVDWKDILTGIVLFPVLIIWAIIRIPLTIVASFIGSMLVLTLTLALKIGVVLGFIYLLIRLLG